MNVRDADDVARLVRDARQRRRMSQQDLAEAAGVSRRWLVALEAGKPRAELNLVLTVLATLGIALQAGLPSEPGRSPDSPASQPAGGIDLDAHLATFHGSL